MYIIYIHTYIYTFTFTFTFRVCLRIHEVGTLNDEANGLQGGVRAGTHNGGS